MGSQASSTTALPAAASLAAAPAQAAPSTDAPAKPKPCCVCKDEKAKRDDCMLFSKSDDPQKDCVSTIDQYRACMAGFGFKV
ncbi:cytochrome C oxidase copper chaperone-domain-containing protein [Pseudoneurospora amorphoporcata]|uniref:Cytochrome C oxidase copper chaperone-domain-containing protein n=1 Tax=Pseudoneurospora amorphoporcata TaxID=241081 RepID=A0AAN6P3W1_9PEZI|nr:cytochrome C oxidase copper chaperone-domain-containing protein [Pseudoneurospora amorphoporcata]